MFLTINATEQKNTQFFDNKIINTSVEWLRYLLTTKSPNIRETYTSFIIVIMTQYNEKPNRNRIVYRSLILLKHFELV